MFEGHSNELVLLLAGCTILIGLFGFLHAKRYWEGLPPILDAFVSMASFLAVIGAFVAGGRIGSALGHPHAGRLVALTLVIIAIRGVRTWLGKEQERYRLARAKREAA